MPYLLSIQNIYSHFRYESVMTIVIVYYKWLTLKTLLSTRYSEFYTEYVLRLRCVFGCYYYYLFELLSLVYIICFQR